MSWKGLEFMVRLLVGKAALAATTACRFVSYLVGGATGVALVASPFIASSVVNWLVLVVICLGVAVLAYLALYRFFPFLLVLLAGAAHHGQEAQWRTAALGKWAQDSGLPVEQAAKVMLDMDPSEKEQILSSYRRGHQ